MTKKTYNKKQKYMKYPFDRPIDKAFNGGFDMIIAIVLHIGAIFLPYFIKMNYVTFDITIISMYAFHYLIIREGILNGKINAYYRRFDSPDGIIISLYNVLLPTSIIRVVAVMAYQVAFGFEPIIEFTLATLKMFNLFSIDFILAASISLITLYFAYYYDRYTTPEEYTLGVAYREAELSMSRTLAKREFCKAKDIEYGLTDFYKIRGYKYNKKKAEKSFQEQQWKAEKVRNNINESDIMDKKNIRDEEIVVNKTEAAFGIRRASRRGEEDDW